MGFKDARNRAGLTAQEVAQRFGVSVTAVFAWEAGQYLPRADRLVQLARYMNCTVDELLGNDSVTNTESDKKDPDTKEAERT